MFQNNNGQPGDKASPGTKHVLDNYTVQSQQSNNDDKSPYYKSSAPSVSLPKGGGALKGIDEKFSVNAINGTAGLSVPLPLTPGRGGFTPSLTLSYNSGGGNSEFGLGWALGLPAIQRKTDKQLPLYDDAGESDVFLLAGAEDLVPQFKNDEGDEDAYITAEGLLVKRYRPRIEGLFARIEFIKNNRLESWWRVTTKDNITTYYGLTAQARLSAPDAPQQVFKWLPELVIDNKGNVQVYSYKQENLDQVPTALHERNRYNGQALFTNLYLKAVHYCNRTPYSVDDEHQYKPSLPDTADFLMEAILDYGEHADTSDHIPGYAPADLVDWEARKDAFSGFHAGFEIRTYRRCRRVLMYHHFDEIKVNGQPAIVRSLDFTYHSEESGDTSPYTEADFITAITQTGYKYHNSSWQKRALPAMTMKYQPLQWNDELKNVSPADAKNTPQGLTGPYQWTDLWGEGLPGILTDQGQSWWYKQNLGDGHFAPVVPVAEKPSLTGLAAGILQWQDLDADGQRQVVVRKPGLEGYFELGPSVGDLSKQCWKNFVPFKHTVNVDWSSPFTKMLDLNGDGKPDILLTNDRVWTWFENEGKEGFTKGGEVSTVLDEEKGPRLVLNDRVQSIFLADMNGDGMTDIVRIKNGEVCYWPNMGYGKFGAKVSMTNAPTFAGQDQFNPLYLQLADISGTGAADLVYLGHNTFRVWINLAGNAFGDAYDIATLPGIEPYSKVAILDFLGNGTGCIVWSSPLPQHSHAPMRYIDLMGGKKPHLMHTYNNGMGKSVTVTYKSSTQYYLEDKAAGTPWATLLPFPVQCIDKITTSDIVSQTAFSQTYRYRHGYYDHEEREFRGFGRVDVSDSEPSDPPFDAPEWRKLDQPVVLTKTWYHTGAWLREQTLLDAFKKEYYHFDGWSELETQAIFPAGLNAEEQREAYRALKGSALRQEVYALDDSAKEEDPYTVTVSSYGIKTVQRRKNNRFASFLVYSDQSLVYSCERHMEDTRLGHTLTLETDEYGNVTKSAQVAYPRRSGFLPESPDPGDPDVLAPVWAAQQRMHITFTASSFTNDIGTSVFDSQTQPPPVPERTYRLRVPYLSNAYELYVPQADYPDDNTLWTVEGLKHIIVNEAEEVDFSNQPTGPDAKLRLLSRALTVLAKDDDLEEPEDIGKLTTLAIPYQQYTLVFTGDVINACFEDGVVDIPRLAEGGYVQEKDIPGNYSNDDTRWWLPSGRMYFTAIPAADFYTPVQFADPWDKTGAPTRTTVAFWHHAGTNYWLLPHTVTDALGNVSEVMRYNWYNLQPEEMKDANDNLSEICYDVLGMPVATAIKGKGEEADYLEYLGTGHVPFDPQTQWEAGLRAAFWSAADPESAAKELLGKATWRCIYDLDSVPVKVAMIGREQHFNAASDVVIRVSYSDGFGRIALNKAQCQPVALPLNGSNTYTARWICSGKTIYNNKGKEVMQYEPFFCEHHSFNEVDYHTEAGVSPKLYYDPLGRVYRTEMPDGTYSYTTWDNWSQTVYDANDTVSWTGNAWYTTMNAGSMEAKDAAAKASAHTDTPTVVHLDTLARPFFTVQQHRRIDPLITDDDPYYRSYETLDIAGNRLAVHDAEGKVPLTYRYNMLNAPCYQESIDGGPAMMLMDVAGQPLYGWSGLNEPIVDWATDGRMTYVSYDRLRRPVAHFVTVGGTTKMLGKTVYADGPTASASLNHRGRVLESYDGGGKHFVDGYDFKGLPLHSYQQLPEDASLADADWTSGAAPALNTEVFTTTAVIDALGRPVTITITDDDAGITQVTRHQYDKGGLLKEVHHKEGSKAEAIYVQDIHYDAKGQRQSIWYGNGTKTRYTYDPKTYRLTRLFTVNVDSSSAHHNKVYQDLNYWYDAVGNITRIRDDAQAVLFYGNSIIEPVKKYTYDALYRLIHAEGREQKDLAIYGQDNHSDQQSFVNSGNNPNAVQGYTQYYEYDGAGNITKLRHHGDDTASRYTRTFSYVNGSNRLSGSSVAKDGNTSPYAYTYDARGNMLSMPHLSVMDWNQENQLSHIVAGTTQAFYQYSGGQRVRKVVVNSGITEERIYLGNLEIYRKFDSTSSLTLERTTVHISDDTGRIAMLETRTFGTDASKAELRRFIYSNHLQSASLELDNNGDIISYEEYHPYGTTSYQAKSATINATAKRYRYTGKERDDESGLNYHGARYYALWLCRWISVDPLESKYAPLSSYNYGLCNPVKWNDPNGMEPNDRDKNKIPTVDNTGHTPLVPPDRKQVVYTPDGGTINIPYQVKQLSYFNKDNPQTLNGQELNIKDGSLNTFDYHGEIFEARFSTKTGAFAGYFSRTDSRHSLTYAKNSLPEWTDKTGQKAGFTMAATMALAAPAETEVPPVAVLQGAAATLVFGVSVFDTFNVKEHSSVVRPASPETGFKPVAMPISVPKTETQTQNAYAVIKQYANGYPEGHFTIEVFTGKTPSLATHQVITSYDRSSTRIVPAIGIKEELIDFAVVPLENGEAAQAYQIGSMSFKNLGEYKEITNSCLSHVIDVINAGNINQISRTQIGYFKFLRSLGFDKLF